MLVPLVTSKECHSSLLPTSTEIHWPQLFMCNDAANSLSAEWFTLWFRDNNVGWDSVKSKVSWTIRFTSLYWSGYSLCLVELYCQKGRSKQSIFWVIPENHLLQNGWCKLESGLSFKDFFHWNRASLHTTISFTLLTKGTLTESEIY